jgi:hypothetical protein
MKRFFFALVIILVVLSAVAALADDLTPPSWRGQAGTTFGVWDFATNNPNPLPDAGYVYPWGLPTIQITPGLFQSWQPNWGGRSGVWPLSGQIELTIPNSPVANPEKDIWIQLTWAEQAPGNTPSVSETRFGVPSSLVSQQALGGGWFHSTYEITLHPNPDWERLLITGGINVDQMVIDTRCVPEPTSLLALSAGLLGLVCKRRR